MKDTEVLVEFVVTGTVGVLLALLSVTAFDPDVLTTIPFPQDALSKAIAGVVGLPAVYYLGIVLHHASWRLWRPSFHSRRFRRIFAVRNDEPHVETTLVRRLARPLTGWFGKILKGRDKKAFVEMRRLARRAHSLAGRPLGEEPSWPALIEWCRFALLAYGSEAARLEYFKQYHLYRAAYGSLFALVVGVGATFVRGFVAHEWWWASAALALITTLLVLAALQRGTRMWKSLCYSIFVALDKYRRDASGEST